MNKTFFGGLALALSLIVLGTATASAADITFVSGDGNEKVTLGGSTQMQNVGVAPYVHWAPTFGGSISAIDYPATKWISEGNINSWFPAGGYTMVITEKVRVDLATITSFKLQVMADDSLIVWVNGKSVWAEKNDRNILWNHITTINVPITYLNNNAENVIQFFAIQGDHYPYTYLALNYKGVITGTGAGMCTESVPVSQQPSINLADVQYVNTADGGATVCPTGRIFIGVDQQDHGGANRLKCAAASNILQGSQTTDVALVNENANSRPDIFHACPTGSIIVGLVQDTGGRETAIRCQTVKSGVINFANPLTWVGAHGRSGDQYEVNFNEGKAGQWVAIGAYYNREPSGSRGIKGYPIAPMATLPAREIPCDVCAPPQPAPVTTTFGSGDGEKIIYNQFGYPGTDPYILSAPSFDQSNGWWSGSAIDYPSTRWISRWANDFFNGTGPEAHTCFTAVEKFTLNMDSITSASLRYLVDDFLTIVLNQKVIHQSGPEWLWLTPNYVSIPVDALNKTGENILSIQACQGTNQAYSQFALNYKGIVTGTRTPANTNTGTPRTALFASNGGETWTGPSNTNGTSIVIAPASTWRTLGSSLDGSGGAGWISIGNSSPTNGKTYVFTETVEVPTGVTITGAGISFLADDGVKEIKFNGTSVFTGTVNSSCNANHPNWQTARTISVPNNLVRMGTNTVIFEVQQNPACNDPGPFGLTYQGEIHYTIPPDSSCNACVAGGRKLTSPIITSQSTAPAGSSAGSACAGDKLHSTVATSYSTKQFVAGTCAATTPGFFTSTNLTKVNKPSNPNATPAKCPGGSVVAEFTESGISCRPVAGGAGALVSGSERTITVGSGTAVNNYFNLFVNGSSKIWAATGVEYDFSATGVPPKSVTIMEVRSAPSCTPLPAPLPDPVPTPSSTPIIPNPIPTPEPNPNPPAPTCTLTATPATIVLNVGSSKLEWNCTGSGSATISAIDNADFITVSGQPAQGSLNVSPDKTTTFKVTLGAISATATVTVGGSIIDETGGL